ncbi:(2Fe-2S)-binding protein [Pigmentibacter sp. JX0631]|uniref:(2Fe-2S)-binding protein n=1 Tax=Pigmentibacter sp. JX0631 TaxID=2976982 RepID=UPI0024692A74|nr:(2Fe-2S)-binding protein [Pigmentibacter sp. JX0631]WGL59844.1 (2Fe-2S)-binding protein [Pigmentibacter sp. JX0631]
MLMCLCYGVSCKDIKTLVNQGFDSKESVQEQCFAGTGCGCCLEALEKLVESEKNLAKFSNLTTSHASVEQDNSLIQYP